MSRITLPRLCVAAVGAATAVLLTAVPAAAHTEVEADKAQALAENVTVSFHAEAESDTSGIKEVRVVLPEGIAPADVTYGEGPKGWRFSATADGYTVKGAELKTGEGAEYSVVVRQLPDAEEVPFKTLQTYGDGHVDRWIELDENGENPAPTLKLKAAAPGAKAVSPSPSASASPSPTARETTPAATPQAADTEKGDEDGLSAGAWTGIGAGILVAAAAVVFAVRRRGGAEE
nr:YcnI family protein [Streptomyces canus]